MGGLAWCIGYVRPEFNRDIMITEGMSLGAKVAISEKIVMYLKEWMNDICSIVECGIRSPFSLSRFKAWIIKP